MDAAPPSRVRFPVIENFAISGYQLYPGVDGTGFATDVQQGVNIVVGINGLGKTTLLTALFRALTGPRDWSKRSLDGPAGVTSTELGDWRTKGYFTKRVPNGARAAILTVTIGFGSDRITITRRMHDLAITSLLVNGQRRANDRDVYEAEVTRLCGLSSFADFYLLLRYLVFFLEDRQSVIWDEHAQSDILRTLFFDPEEADRTRKLQAEIQTKDSQIRNFRYAIKQYKDRLEKMIAQAAVGGEVRAEAAALRTQLDAARDAAEDAKTELAEIEDRYATERRDLENARFTYDAKQAEYEELEAQYFAHAYPHLGTVAQYVFSHATSGGGCLACGDRSAQVQERVRRMLERGLCPVCESEPGDREAIVPPHALASRRLSNLDAEVGALREVMQTLEREVQTLITRRTKTRERLTTEWAKQAELEERYRIIEGKLPKDDAALEETRHLIVGGRKELEAMNAEREELEKAYRPRQEAGEARVRELADAIIARFNMYAEYFLADRCTLRYAKEDRRIGTEGPTFGFPRFHVELSSGVFEHTARPREEPHEVSESQKEFIDLAFRMALISVASGAEPAMLVLETPEATLDAVFITRAGRLLAHFAAGESKANRLIASCNLNQTHMISALFGVVSPKERKYLEDLPEIVVPPSERASRVVNLLDVAVKNAALERFGELYTANLHEVLYPELYLPAGATDTPAGPEEAAP